MVCRKLIDRNIFAKEVRATVKIYNDIYAAFLLCYSVTSVHTVGSVVFSGLYSFFFIDYSVYKIMLSVLYEGISNIAVFALACFVNRAAQCLFGYCLIASLVVIDCKIGIFLSVAYSHDHADLDIVSLLFKCS